MDVPSHLTSFNLLECFSALHNDKNSKICMTLAPAACTNLHSPATSTAYEVFHLFLSEAIW